MDALLCIVFVGAIALTIFFAGWQGGRCYEQCRQILHAPPDPGPFPRLYKPEPPEPLE